MSDSEVRAGVRSWLFAPGDSARKMEKAVRSGADVVLLDLEDSVAEEAKPAARKAVAEFLQANPAERTRLWVRINPIDGPHGLADLVAICPARPGGVMLPKVGGRAEIETVGHYLTALETAAGSTPGEIGLIIVCTETPQAMFAAGDYAGAPRLAALTWGAEDLATALGAAGNRDDDGDYDFTYKLARSLCLLGAAVVGVPAIETIHGDFQDPAGLERVASAARRAGFSGMIAIHPNQVATINGAFTPTPEEVARAREVVALFDANPSAGTVGHNGAMLDRPHLVRAQLLLKQAGGA